MAPTKLKPVDAVVVGSGVVGSIMSMELANAGLKVLCLERGRMIDPSILNIINNHTKLVPVERPRQIIRDGSRR